MTAIDFTDKVALVTGGTSGIGAACVAALSAAGARVVACALHHPETMPQRCDFRRVDVRDDRQVADLMAHIQDRFGRLDLAVNCAGVSHPPARLADLPPEQYRDVMATNVDGVFFCLRHELRAMLASGGGAIVNIASILSRSGAAWVSAYGASKHAVIGLTQSAALEYGDRGIRVNAVSPGPVATPMFERAMAQVAGDLSKFAGGLPTGGPASPASIAEMVLFLLSDQARTINGAEIVADRAVSAGQSA